MKRLFSIVYIMMLFLAANVEAAQTRVFVGEFNAVGVPNRDELKTTLQTLLSSRLNSDNVLAVGSAAEADVLVSGTYIAIGKVFSVDALVRSVAGKTLARTFIQGETGEELIPVIGRLADKLAAELAKLPAAPVAGTVLPQPRVAPVAHSPDFVKALTAQQASSKSEFIKPQESGAAPGGWLSKRLEGAAELMAVGRVLADGSREILLAQERKLTLYHQGSEMKTVAEYELGNGFKILSVDTVEVDGGLEIYLTLIRNGEPASQLLHIKGGQLVKLAENLPWYFRSISLAGAAKKMFAQASGREQEFFGDVFEVIRQGAGVTTGKSLRLPVGVNLYSFNQFRNADGLTATIMINSDGYLVVFDHKLKEIWRSNDKYGGSELYFQREDPENTRTTGDKYRWIFINQRIQVSAKGEILVGKNGGMWVLGNARSYSKGAVYCFVWNGSSLEEKWRTKETQNYMPDYYYDEARNELMMLQIVQSPGMLTNGASSLAIKKVE